ncbi:MAG TPA: efflux RND transporter permease subunit, partial [Candidatus Ozemobacteraceae bacterium]|nr:efflux RND transporter permease subunit [Candidatus Ozemobacteraceae bacterium]
VDVDLASLGTTQDEPAVTMLTRENLDQTLDLLGSNVDRPVSAVGRDVEMVIRDFPFPPGYTAQLRGTPADMADAGERRAVALKRGMIFLVLVLILMFETVWHPLLIVASIPLALIWGMWGLVLFDKPMCVPALSGFILLGGTIVNNAIILLDFIEQARVQGCEKRQALLDSVKVRLRPIFVTTFSTVLGLLPLTFEQAIGLERLSPLGVVASCGLFGGTLMTMIVIPVLYDVVTDVGAWLRHCGRLMSLRPAGSTMVLVIAILASTVTPILAQTENSNSLPVSAANVPSSETDRCWSVRDCLSRALTQSPMLSILVAEKRAARGAKEEVAASWRPQIETAGSIRHWDRRRVGMLGIAPTERQFYDRDLSEFRLTIRQLLWDGGQIGDRLQAASLLAQSKGLQIERARAEIQADVWSIALSIFTTEALLEASEKALTDIRATLTKMQDMVSVGKVPHVDVLRVQSRVQEVLETQEVYRQARANHLAHLSTVMGETTAIASLSRDGLPEQSFEEDADVELLVQKAMNRRADVEAARLATHGAKKQVQAQQKGTRPQLFLNATANRYGDGSGWGRELGFVGAEVQWTLDDGGRTRARVRQARAQADQATERERLAELKVAEQVRVAAANVRSAKARCLRNQANLRLAAEAFRIEQLKYEQGKGTINDVLDAEAAKFFAEAQVIRSHNEALAAQIALETSVR